MSPSKLLAGILTVALVATVSEVVSQRGTLSELREHQARSLQQLEKIAAEKSEVLRARDELAHEVARLKMQRVAAQTGGSETNPASGPASVPAQTVGKNDPTARPAARTERNLRQGEQWRLQYAQFFQQRGLSPAQVDQVIELFARQAEARSDLQAAVEKSGLPGDTEGVEKLRSQLYAPILDDLRAILGNDGYAAYNEYQRTSYYRAIITPVVVQFSSANVPLTLEQNDQSMRIVMANDHPRKVKPTDIGSVTEIDWDNVAVQAPSILTPAQITILQIFAQQRKSSK